MAGDHRHGACNNWIFRNLSRGKSAQDIDPRALARQRAEHHRAAADQHHRVENRGVHMQRHPLDESPGEERAGKRHDPDQQRERDLP